MNIFDIIRRSRQHLPLTPAERAFLKFVQGLVLTVITAMLAAVAQLILNKGLVSWQEIGTVAATAASVAVLNALVKFLNARNDPLLPTPPQPSEAPVVTKAQEGQ